MGRGPGIRATSGSSIQIDFKWQGRRYRERLRLAPTPANLRYAARLKATIEHEIATRTFDFRKHFPDSPRTHSLAGATVSQALTAYCDSLSGSLEPETIDEYRKDSAILAKAFNKPLQSLTRADVRDWVSKSSLSKKRLDNLLIPFRGAIRQAIEDGALKSSPLADFKIRRVAGTAERIDPFTPQEIAALSGGSLGAVWAFWAWSGLRTGELIGLEWRDVDRQAGRIHIRRAVRVGREKSPKTKSGNRTLALLPAARAALECVETTQGPVFTNPNTGKRWHEDRALARAFRKACEASGVRYRYPYQLRHTFATWALSSGENPAWIARYMGHSDVMMLFRVYGKWMPQLDPQAGSKMAGRAA